MSKHTEKNKSHCSRFSYLISNNCYKLSNVLCVNDVEKKDPDKKLLVKTSQEALLKLISGGLGVEEIT